MELWKKPLNWKFLPDDCLFFEIFEFLDTKTLLKIRRVCKKWGQFINKTIWDSLIKEQKVWYNLEVYDSCSWKIFISHENRIKKLFDSTKELVIYLNKNRFFHSLCRNGCSGCRKVKKEITYLEIKHKIKKEWIWGLLKVIWTFIKFIFLKKKEDVFGLLKIIWILIKYIFLCYIIKKILL